MEINSKTYHWFVNTADTWIADNDLFTALNRLKDHTTFNHCNLWRIPGDADQEYSIEFYKPQVAGAEFIGTTKL